MKNLSKLSILVCLVVGMTHCKPAGQVGVSEVLDETNGSGFQFLTDLTRYERVESLGVPFLDTGLGERKESWNIGAQNIGLQLELVKRLWHLSWSWAPAFNEAGYDPCFYLLDINPFNGDNGIPADRESWFATTATPRLVRCFLQRVKMPDDSWKLRDGPKEPIIATLFWPNTLIVDLDTTGTFPFGRRLEDPVYARFMALTLNLHSGKCGKDRVPCHADILMDRNQASETVNFSRTGPGFPINPEKNDKPFRSEFPYLAEPWPADYPRGDGGEG